MTTESVSLEYAELRLEQVATQVVPTEDDLRKLYDDNRASYVLDERRRARHILIPVDGDDDAGALKQAESVLAEARAGKDFAELAKKYSKDSTAAEGGELGFVQKKDFPGPFGDTLFAMNVGDIAGAGQIAVRLPPHQARGDPGGRSQTVRVGARRARFAVSPGALRELVRRVARKTWRRRSKRAKPISTRSRQELGLTRGSIAEFLRGGGAEPLGSSVDLQQVVFGDAVLNQGKIGGPVPLGEDRLVLVKVTGSSQGRGQTAGAGSRRNRGVAQAGARCRRRRKRLPPHWCPGSRQARTGYAGAGAQGHRRPGAFRGSRRSFDSRPLCAPRSSKRRVPKQNPWSSPPSSMTDPRRCSW